jgi:predicted glycoside hydrolase/deacetylase ChbG (UPF0249 family)
MIRPRIITKLLTGLLLPLWAMAAGCGPAVTEEPGMSTTKPDAAPAAATAGPIRLIARADDMGFCHAANVACIQAYKNGIIRSVEVQSPGPWFYEAAAMLRENPGLDVGVHLTLTCEWANYKWGPITPSPSLAAEEGYFHPSTKGFLDGKPDPAEFERELRAQIERAVRHIPQVSHLSCHMGTPTARPDLRAIVEKLAAEYKLPVRVEGVRGGFGFWGEPADKKQSILAEKLEALEPGLWIFVCHPALETAETRAIGGTGTHDANVRMAVHRQIVTDALTSPRIRQIIQRRNIQLISYADAIAAGAKPVGGP